ncbi:MAG: NUDIX domain-containing protein [Sneathiella sp.]|nr:NUDIX domain-containing protein [Sneathiella sp.]
MSISLPSTSIRVKAFGLAWRDKALLASEILNDAGEIKGIRPLGGIVEYGEIWQDALKREFLEKLRTEIILTGQPDMLENIYSHPDVTGHEIIFLSNIFLVDQSLYSQDVIQFSEQDGTMCTARWFDLSDLEKSGPKLYPTGLLDKIKNKSFTEIDNALF